MKRQEINYKFHLSKQQKNRIDHAATVLAKEMGIEYTHFYFHDLKRKGMSNTEGDKLKASGYRNASMLNIYDIKLDVAKSA